VLEIQPARRAEFGKRRAAETTTIHRIRCGPSKAETVQWERKCGARAGCVLLGGKACDHVAGAGRTCGRAQSEALIGLTNKARKFATQNAAAPCAAPAGTENAKATSATSSDVPLRTGAGGRTTFSEPVQQAPERRRPPPRLRHHVHPVAARAAERVASPQTSQRRAGH